MKAGVYNGFASGQFTNFDVDGEIYTAKFENAVKGINVPDRVTVTLDGIISSQVLGKQGVLNNKSQIPNPKIKKVITTTTTYELTEQEVATIIRKHLGVPDSAKVDFNISGYHEYLENVIVTEISEEKE